MAEYTLLAATTSATQSTSFHVPPDQTVTVMCSPDLAGSETADIQISHDGGSTWADYIDVSAVELSASKNAVRLHGPMRYRVDKDATAGSTGIFLHYLEQFVTFE